MSGSRRLEGKRALITGAAGGLGLAIAQRFDQEGARVAICDIDAAALAVAGRRHPHWICMRTDVSDEDDVQAMFDRLQSEFRGLDVLVNNAGIAGPTAPIENIRTREWQSVFDVNVLSAFFCTRLAAPMLKAQGGAVVIMSSIAGRLGVPFRTPYVSAKFALVGLTKSLALELGPHKIRVNAILPGLTSGDRLDGVIRARAAALGRTFEDQKYLEVQRTALGEMGEPIDIANAALYLSSDEGRMVTGVALAVDSGLESLTFR